MRNRNDHPVILMLARDDLIRLSSRSGGARRISETAQNQR